MDELEDKFVNRLEQIAIEKGCKPLPLGFLSILDQSDEATKFWKQLAAFCCHAPKDTKAIDEAIRYEFKYRHGLL